MALITVRHVSRLLLRMSEICLKITLMIVRNIFRDFFYECHRNVLEIALVRAKIGLEIATCTSQDNALRWFA